ncbi:Peroxisomal multifunctional enzyme type 2 [Ceratobasidium theobromae]|uniref:Peroxisomal multifunctional enzyme type 2 n=1 Tax=Ceratobasidium theobromae TaxID=1582974 RepID=A0A5N5QSY8_9AGAM|nr:Peroxisomal multifunctional enzyme type 2 [Ceratobasidium theobromae]
MRITCTTDLASDIIVGLGSAFDSLSEAQKKAQIKKTNGVFELRVSTEEPKKEAVWTIDLKNEGTVKKGPAGKPDVVIILSGPYNYTIEITFLTNSLIIDETFTLLANGKITGQKAFMTGKLKTKGTLTSSAIAATHTSRSSFHYHPYLRLGNMMLAIKLEEVLKASIAFYFAQVQSN